MKLFLSRSWFLQGHTDKVSNGYMRFFSREKCFGQTETWRKSNPILIRKIWGYKKTADQKKIFKIKKKWHTHDMSRQVCLN